MRPRNRVWLYTLLLAVIIWLVDALLDSVLFYAGSFHDLAFTNIPPHELYIRVLIVVLLVVFGAMITRIIGKLERAEGRLARAYISLRVISEVNQVLVRITKEEELLKTVAEILVDQGHFSLVWIGERKPAAPDGEFVTLMQERHAPLRKPENGGVELTQGCLLACGVGQASGTVPVNLIRRDLDAAELDELSALASRHGFKRSIVLPLSIRNSSEAAVVLLCDKTGSPLEDDDDLLRELAGDLSYGLSNLRLAKERDTLYRDLLESKARYNTVLNNYPNGFILVFDSDFRYLIAGGKGLEKIGFSPDQFLGRSLREVLDPETAERLDPLYRAAFSGVSSQVELQIESTWFEIIVEPIREGNGSIRHGLVMTQIISARKEADRALRLLANIVETSEDAILTEDLEGMVLSWNAGAERIYGYTSAEMVRNSITLIEPEDRRGEIRALLQKVRSGQGIVQHETERVRRDGRRIQVSLTISPLRDEGNRIIGVSTISRDITERRELEDQYRQSQKMESIGRLAGGIAHDFNNLLTGIIGQSDMLRIQLREHEMSVQMVDEILATSDRAARLVSQLLAFSRKQVIQPRTVDLNESIGSLRSMLQRIIGEDINLIFKPKAGLESVLIDPSLIEQVLVNLVVNSRDAMPHGGQITIETGNTSFDEVYSASHAEVQPGDYVLLAVSDNGEGMGPEVLANVFEPFFTTKASGKGTGLGLATVYGIVRQHNGHAHVYSEPGSGTTFRLYFPRVEPSEEEPHARGPEPMSDPSGTETVLIVEDDSVVREMAAHSLERYGYTTLLASNLEEAKTHFDSGESIAILLVDVVMPEMSGPRLTAKLRERYGSRKLLYMSGYTANAIVHHGVLDEGVQFIQKPFRPVELARKVRATLDQS